MGTEKLFLCQIFNIITEKLQIQTAIISFGIINLVFMYPLKLMNHDINNVG